MLRSVWVRRGLAVASAAAVAGLAALGVTPAQAAGGRTFSHPIHVDTDNLTGEPSITVGPDGTEYVVAPDGPGVRTPAALGAIGTGGSLVWRSTDHGASWKLLGSYDVPTGGGDSDIVVAPDGTLYASGLSYVACSTVSRSTDHGKTWLPMPLAGCAQQPLGNDRQWNALVGDHTVYTVIGDTLDAQIDLVRSTITTPAVVPSTRLQLTRAPDYQWPGRIAVDQRNGTAYIVWNTTGAPNDCDGAPGAASCKPAAASSKTADRIVVSVLPKGADAAPKPRVVAVRHFDTFDSFVTVAVDRAGAVYASWSERHPARHATWAMLAVSHDNGRTWSRPVKVDRVPRTVTFPWVTAGDRGRVAVSYYGTTATGWSPQTVPAGADWHVFSAFSTDGGRSFTEYRTTPTMHRGPICTSGTGCRTGTRNLLDFFATAADVRGCLVTAYADNTVDPANGAAVSYVRQTAGPGLRAGRACNVPG